MGYHMSVKVRFITNKLIELAEEGTITWEQIAQAALTFMSEHDVAEMSSANEFFICMECGSILDEEEEINSSLCENCRE